jgi:hypothetical protein
MDETVRMVSGVPPRCDRGHSGPKHVRHTEASSSPSVDCRVRHGGGPSWRRPVSTAKRAAGGAAAADAAAGAAAADAAAADAAAADAAADAAAADAAAADAAADAAAGGVVALWARRPMGPEQIGVMAMGAEVLRTEAGYVTRQRRLCNRFAIA